MSSVSMGNGEFIAYQFTVCSRKMKNQLYWNDISNRILINCFNAHGHTFLQKFVSNMCRSRGIILTKLFESVCLYVSVLYDTTNMEVKESEWGPHFRTRFKA